MERESEKLHLELQTLEFSSNPMFQHKEKEDRPMTDEEHLKAVKTHPEFLKMATSLKELNSQLRESKKAASDNMEKAKGAKFKMLVVKGKEEFSQR